MFRWMLYRLMRPFGDGNAPVVGGLVCGTPWMHSTVRGTPGMEEC